MRQSDSDRTFKLLVFHGRDWASHFVVWVPDGAGGLRVGSRHHVVGRASDVGIGCASGVLTLYMAMVDGFIVGGFVVALAR